MKLCLLDETKLCDDCGECSRCDLNPNKICDSCGRCLESDADSRAIYIDGIFMEEEGGLYE